MLVEVTKTGVYRENGQMIPVGTQVEIPDNFRGWANKYRVINRTEGKTLQPATPEPDPEPQEDDSELRDEYEHIIGKRPGPRMKPETMRNHIAEAQSDDEG